MGCVEKRRVAIQTNFPELLELVLLGIPRLFKLIAHWHRPIALGPALADCPTHPGKSCDLGTSSVVQSAYPKVHWQQRPQADKIVAQLYPSEGAVSDVKIPVAYVGKIRYCSEELDEGSPRRVEIVAASRAGTLTDGDYRQVKAVPAYEYGPHEDIRKVRSHFSPVGESDGTALEATEVDPTHEGTVETLASMLSKFDSAFVVATNHLTETETITVSGRDSFSVPAPSEIWRCPPGCTYTWMREPATRNWRDGKYVQPDLVGFDAYRPWPGPSNPTVIVEVINWHTPEVESWTRLMELSRNHHLVLFYLCTAKSKKGKFGKTTQRKVATGEPPLADWLWLQVAFYMKEGVFYDGAKPFRFTSNDVALQAVEASRHIQDIMKKYMR